MAQPYLQQPPYDIHAPAIWEGNAKHNYPGDGAYLVDGPAFHEAPPHTMADPRLHRQPSAVKLEEDFHTQHTWQQPPHSPSFQARHYSVPNIPHIDTQPRHMPKMYEQPYTPHYGPPHAWPMPPASGTSTPTPHYGPVAEPGMPISFNSATGMYPYQQHPHRSVAMSPQSSQGGWVSATSDDSTTKLTVQSYDLCPR
jgi:hypothetical protein